MKRQIFRFAFFLLICLTLPLSTTAQGVDILDTSLRAAIEAELGKASGDTITTADMANLTGLHAPNANITNLIGIEHATNLTFLNLQSNNISDISPLEKLTKLTALHLSSNKIEDISPVVDLTKLTELGLGNNFISNISPLTDLTELNWLSLEHNQIEALRPLAGLTNLTRLRLWNNTISDISVLARLTNLIDLGLGYNAITDRSILSGLTNLTSLDLRGTNTSDLSVLSGLTKLERLYIDRNGISDLSPLAGLTNLTDLALNSNSISDLSSLRGLTNLEWMRLAENNITDLSPLVANTGLGSGDEIHVNDNPLNRESIETHIPALRKRGVTVEFDVPLEEPVNIPDDNLRAKIKDTLGIASGDPILPSDMANLTRLDAPNANISNLTGLEHATNLRSLWLHGEEVRPGVWENSNSVSDLSPIEDLTQLKELDLWQNSVTDISALAGLTNLTHLGLVGNDISDVLVLTGLTKLESLWLDGNPISNISALAGLTQLTRLGLDNTSILDISALAGLTNLTWMRMGRNNITNISPLVENTGLGQGDEVHVRGNPLNHASIQTHIPALERRGVTVEFDNIITELVDIPDDNLRAKIADALGKASDAFITTTDMERLTELHARNADISNLTGLESATNLTRLDLGTEYVVAEDRSINSNSVSDLSPLAGLTNLTWLRLRNNSISDISPLARLTNLEWLNLGGNLMISDISVLSGLTNLTSLYLYGNSVSDISVLAGLTNLTFLNLWFNSVSDLSPLAGLTNLTWLGLDNNLVSDLSPLTGLTNLEWLGLSNHSTFIPATGLTHLTSININNNAISDLSPLVENTGLGVGDFVEVWGNPLSDASIQTHIPALQNRGVRVEFIQTPTFLLKISGTVTASDNLLIVEVRDNRDRAFAGVTVTFTVVSGGGTLSVTDALTDANGRAESRLTLGPNTGTNTVRASVAEISEPVTFSDMPEPPVDIPDSHLRAAIESALDKSSGDIITASDMARLRRLTARNANISNLTGLEGATNLTRLDLGGEWVEGSGQINSNSISNLSPLSGLTNLSNLILDRNAITDISPLSELTNLEWLWLPNNSITDLSPLAELTNLGALGLQNNNLSEISPLAELTNLADLFVSGNSISDISILSKLPRLVLLGLSNNNISDISPVAELTNLKSLQLSSNSISDISVVAGLTNLTNLSLDGNSVSDISAVAGLTSLTGLILGNNSISDISAVAGLTNLEFLILEDNSISDISAVVGLTNLRFLILGDNSIVDLSPLVENTGLGERDWVDVERNPLSFSSIYTHIPALRSRGVGVGFQPPEPDLLSGHTDAVVSVAFSRDGTLASGGRDGTVILWDAVTEQPLHTLTGHTASARSVAFSPEGNILASGSHDGTVILWDAATQQPKNTLTEHTAGVETVAFSRDGSTLASGSHNGTIILWDVANGQPKYTIMGQANRVWSLAFSPDGTLAIGRDDGTILLWDVANGRPKYTLIGGHTAWVESVAFSRDGSTLASGSGDNAVILWEVATGRPIAILPGHTAGVNSVAFNPAGTLLASGADDSTVRLWDAVTGQSIATLTGHMSFVRSVAFSPDGTTLASGSGDSTVRLWEIGLPALPEYTLSVPKGINLIHVPLKVTEVDGKAKTIESISDLYHALGGASKVNFLITYDVQTQEWRSYFGTSDTGTPADRVLTDETGIIAGLIDLTSVHLRGDALGTNGSSTITLSPGLNVAGLPLNDSRIERVSDLLKLEGIADNVSVVIVSDEETFKVVGRADDPGDIPIVGGQAFILTAQWEDTVTISGDAWVNDSGTAAAPLLSLKSSEVGHTTPVLGLRGSIASEGTNANQAGFRVTVKNLSTDKKLATATPDDEMGYRLTVVDIETGRATTVGDILEISAQSPNPFIGVEPFRYTVTAEDVKRSLIQLPELVAYEIPAETQLLANYPNPFNPETWIPYRLAEDALVTLTIYDLNGQVVRTLDVGHQTAAVYENRSKAIYWDGRNELGEQVASGVYFYHLSAGDFSATRKMVILK